MGRLQRKKSLAVRKKKKDKEASRASIPVKNKTDAVLPEDSVKAAKKQKAIAPRKPLSIAKPVPPQQKRTIISKTVQFLREVKMELKKVTWPTREEAINLTIIVIVVTFGMSAFLGIVDFLFSRLFALILGV